MSDYSSNFPQQRPALNLDFANSGKLDSRISFSRADTPPTYAAPSAVHYWSNEKHLSSENLISQSEDLGSWSDANPPYTTVTSNATAAPDGTTTAAQITGLAGTNKKAIYHPISAGTGSYTSVCFVKPDGHEYVQLMFGGAATIYQNYHLSGSGTLGNGTNDAASIDQLGDWYRITITSSSLISANNYYLVMVNDNTAARYQDSSTTGSIFAWGANFSSTNQKVFNSTTTQIHREYSSTLKSVANAGDPRFEYAADGQSVGLLIESQASNLQAYSSDFTSWSGQNRVTTTANVAIAPNGLLEADIVVANTSSTQSHNLSNTSTLASGTTYTASVYAKDAGQRYIQLSGSTGIFGSSQYATFDLQTGSVDANGVTASAESVGNGWYRIQATMTATSSGSGGATIGLANSATASRLPLFTGNEYDGIILFGYQLEVGSASSLISTSGSTASRAADSCSVADFGYTGGPVSVVSETSGGYGSFPGCWVIKNSTGSEALQLYKQSAAATEATDFRVYANSGGTNTVDTLITSSASAGKIAVSYGTNDVAFTASGNAVQTDTSASSIGAVDTLIIGAITTTNQLNGHIKRLSLFNVALSDAELKSLTSS
jgi:hypothetical protein